MKSNDPQQFDHWIDQHYTHRCILAGKCLVCGWKPRPEFASMYYEWQAHFKQLPLTHVSTHADQA